MKHKYTPLLSLLFLLPQCASINPKKTFAPIQDESAQRINIQPTWRHTADPFQVTQLLDRGITMQEAIAIGLNNNPQLQAQFEELGIRKADLVQAGFYSNPHVETLFRIPKNNSDLQTNVEFDASITLSDLWQVPLRKKVARDTLEIKTYEIVNEILKLRRDIQQQYVMCAYNLAYLQLVKEITSTIKALKERIEYRYQFGFGTKLDTYFAASKLGEWQAKIIDATTMLHTSYIALHELLGGYISSQSIQLRDSLHTPHIALSQQQLEQTALASHPLILIEQAKMARAQHEKSYEESRIIDNVQLGISYERDFEKGTAGVGPAFGIDIPLFNSNYGNIERARFAYKQAEKNRFAQQQMIMKDILSHYHHYQSYRKQIAQYEQNVVPYITQAIQFSKEYFDRMQMDMIVFLETQIELFNSKIKLLGLQQAALREYSELEFVVGAQLHS